MQLRAQSTRFPDVVFVVVYQRTTWQTGPQIGSLTACVAERAYLRSHILVE
jgi:hypothetical protein